MSSSLLDRVEAHIQKAETIKQRDDRENQLVWSWFNHLYTSMQTDSKWKPLYDRLPSILADRVTTHGKSGKYRGIMIEDYISGNPHSIMVDSVPHDFLATVSFHRVHNIVYRYDTYGGLVANFPSESHLNGFRLKVVRQSIDTSKCSEYPDYEYHIRVYLQMIPPPSKCAIL